MRTFAIANAQYYGNGLCIAPDAKVNDGVFDIFACGEVSVIDFILHSIPLKAGRRIKHSKVQYLKSRDVELSSDEPLEIEADGEIIGWLPARVKISEVKLKIIKG
jgi:diacylglycerol kinase family enzyme